jgi:hypothetical protein
MEPEVLLAILILVAGWIFTLLYDYCAEKKRLKERVKYFAKSLKVILPDIISQSDNYKKVANDISDINKFRYKLGEVTGLNFHFFYPNIIEDLHSFLSSKEIRDPHLVIKKITNASNGIKVQFDNFKYNYLQFKELQEANYERWNQGVNNILIRHDKLFKEDMKNKKLTEFVKNIRETIGTFHKLDAGNVEEIQNEFVIPIFNICEKSEDIRCLEIKREAQSTIYAYENLVAGIEHYSKLFLNDSKQTKKHYDNLESKLNQIQKLL